MEGEGTAEELHVLMVAFGAQGHINPLLRLGKKLVLKGLHVTLATTEIAYQNMVKSSGPQHTDKAAAAPLSVSGIDILPFSDGFSIDYDRDQLGVDLYIDAITESGPEYLSNLVRDHFCGGSKKLSCIIGNPFVAWVADVAAEHKVPYACFWIQPCAIFTMYYHFYNNLSQFPTLENPDVDVNLPGLPLLHEEDLPSFLVPTNTFGSIPKLLKDMFQNLNKVKWVFGNSFYELEKEVIDSMKGSSPILTVGPAVPASLLGQDENLDVGVELLKPQDACMDWLDQQSPSSVIYISFGSFLVFSAEQKESIATALKNSTRPFLWVIKGEAENSTQDGATGLPTWFLQDTKGQGLIVGWCPQTKVLAHPAMACFLTHCGWNSTLEAITAGVPMIAYPSWTDQPTNAKLVVDIFHVGLRLEKDSNGVLGSEEVQRVIEEIFVGPKSEEVKRNAAKLKRAAVEAAADGGSSDLNIQLFVDEISSHNLHITG